MIDLYLPHDAAEQQAMAAWAVPFLRPAVNSPKDFGHYTAIAALRDNAPVAVVLYNNYVGHDIHMTIASNNAAWASRKTLRGFFAYPFNQLGCARITAATAKNNKAVRAFLERLGFRLEGNQRKGYLGQGDMLYFGMLKSECRWIV